MEVVDKAGVKLQAGGEQGEIALFGGTVGVDRQKRGGGDLGRLFLALGKGGDGADVEGGVKFGGDEVLRLGAEAELGQGVGDAGAFGGGDLANGLGGGDHRLQEAL